MLIDINETRVGEIVASKPKAASVFRKLNIDYCCGGKVSLADACLRNGINPQDLLEEINSIDNNPSIPNLKFDNFEIDFLMDYIVNVHHKYPYENLPEVEFYVNKVYGKHKDNYVYLHELAQLFLALEAELMEHLPKEENILFPYSKKLLNARKVGVTSELPPFGSFSNPIKMMLNEHENAGEVLLRIREITHDYTPPEGACNSHIVMLDKLKELDADLIQHIHLENNILFPKIELLEAETV